MKTVFFRPRLVFFLLCLVFFSSAVLFSQQRADRPPEYKEFRAALRIEDLTIRVEELERIRAAYPNSPYIPAIDNAIKEAKIGLAPDLDTILNLHELQLESTPGARSLSFYYVFCMHILRHKNLARFDKKKVTEAVEQYADQGFKLASDPEFLKTVTSNQQEYIKSNILPLHVALALAYLNEGNPDKALKALEDFKKSGGVPGAIYYYTAASASAALGKTKDALDGYLEAAAKNYSDSAEKAREYWQKVYGSNQGFESAVEARQHEIPFQVEQFQPTGAWSGKAVLAELFTGSECPPCVAADLGFDGIIEAYGSKFVAVLEYHLPIPRPDPMTNLAARARAQFYGVRSAPSTFFDGENAQSGGGRSQMAEEKYKAYAAEIEDRVYSIPQVSLQVSAKLNGDNVEVTFSADKNIRMADYNLALVQKEEKCQGGNRITFHKMVVRDFLTLAEGAVKARAARFNIPKAEQDAEARLSELEKERGFTFKESHSQIDRQNLLVVFFLQDKDTKQVYNAVVARIEK
jgi:tetratricopeptide (TPR) repeat protein